MKERRVKIVAFALFIVYSAVMLLLLFHRLPRTGHEYNLKPFATIHDYFLVMQMRNPWEAGLRAYGWINFLGNILAFVPLGVFLPFLFRPQRKIWIFLLTVVLVVSAVELLQLWTRQGALDVDDLILNIPGACLGWTGWRFLSKKTSQ